MMDFLSTNLAAMQRCGYALSEADLSSSKDAVVTPQGVALREASALIPMQASSRQVEEAAAWLPGDVCDASLVAVVGGGAGHVLEALLRRRFPGRILVFEPSQGACLAALRRVDWSPLLDSHRLRWLVGPTYDRWLDAWTWLTPGQPPAVVIHPVLGRTRPRDVRAALEMLKKLVVNAASNERARRRFAPPYLLNTLANLRHVIDSSDVVELAGRFAGKPAVIAAAGPSLNRNLEELQPVRERALVVAVDTALRPCLSSGVDPDFVVALDPGEANLRHLDVGTAPLRTRLVAEPSVAPGSFGAFGPPAFTFRVADHDPWPWLQGHGLTRGRLAAWGSVLATALDFAVSLGCDPVVLIGADFAYTNGQPYCRGTVYEEDWSQMVARGMTLEDVWGLCVANGTVTEADLLGQPVRTTQQLVAFRDWVEQYCSARRVPAILNATGGGILRGVSTAELGHLLGALPLLTGSPEHVATTAQPARGLTSAPWGFEQDPPTPWSEWSALTGRSVLQLVAMLRPALLEGQWELLSEAYAEYRLTDVARLSTSASASQAILGSRNAPPASQVRAVRQWRRLHAEGYLTTHPIVSDLGNTLGLEGVLKHLEPTREDSVLELGCGKARLLQHLAPRVHFAIGLDIAKEPLDLAAHVVLNHANVRLLLGDGLSLHPISDGELTAIFSVAVLQHIPRAATADYMSEFARVLKPHGRACLQFFSDGSGSGDIVDEPGEQSISYTGAQVCDLVDSAGLRLVHLERVGLESRYPGRNFSELWVLCERP